MFAKPDFMHGYRGVQYERRYVARFTVIGRFFKQYKRNDVEKHRARADRSDLTDRVLGQGLPGHDKIEQGLAAASRALPTVS